MPVMELERLWQRLQPFQVDKMPLSAHHIAAAGPAHRWCSAGCIGYGPEMVVKVSTPNGRRMVSSGMSFI